MLTAIKSAKWFRIGIRVVRIAVCFPTCVFVFFVCLFVVSVCCCACLYLAMSWPSCIFFRPGPGPGVSPNSQLWLLPGSIVIPARCGGQNFKMAAFGGHWSRLFLSSFGVLHGCPPSSVLQPISLRSTHWVVFLAKDVRSILRFCKRLSLHILFALSLLRRISPLSFSSSSSSFFSTISHLPPDAAKVPAAPAAPTVALCAA